MPRCIWDGATTQEYSSRPCGFCDMSKLAYAAVIYLVIKTSDGHHIRFLTSKASVASLKSQTIPWLEPLFALLLARLLKSVTTSLEFELTLDSPSRYIDSEVALYWITGFDRVWKQFVQRHVL